MCGQLKQKNETFKKHKVLHEEKGTTDMGFTSEKTPKNTFIK